MSRKLSAVFLALFLIVVFIWAQKKSGEIDRPPADFQEKELQKSAEDIAEKSEDSAESEAEEEAGNVSGGTAKFAEPDVLREERGSNNGESEFVSPLDRAEERVTKKPFGMFITPQNSPVFPERFNGYHLGADFEVFPEEIERDVFVRAVCAGEIIVKRRASGYGGVVVQECEAGGAPISVIYGHLDLESVTANVGLGVSRGEVLGMLGADKSAATDGERKHLHLAFHKGREISIRGYAGSEQELENWLDPCLYVCSD